MDELTIHDPHCVTGTNLHGIRPITQADIDQLMRYKTALMHVVGSLRPMMTATFNDAQSIVDGTYTEPTMTDAEKEIWFKVEDYRDMLEAKQHKKTPSNDWNITMIDTNGNVI
jgi:hypothetical protein